MRFILGVLAIAVGFLFIWKSEWLLENFGRVEWGELHLSGGSRSFYKLAGFVIIVAAFLLMSGIIEGILTAIFIPGQRN